MNTNEARIRIRIMLYSPSLSRHLSELEREALQYALDHWVVPGDPIQMKLGLAARRRRTRLVARDP